MKIHCLKSEADLVDGQAEAIRSFGIGYIGLRNCAARPGEERKHQAWDHAEPMRRSARPNRHEWITSDG